MRKVIISLFLSCFAMVGLYAEQRQNPRGGTISASPSATFTARGQKESELRATAAENTRVNRATNNRGVVTNERVGARAVVQTSRVATTARTAQVKSGATGKSSTAARSAVKSATINAIANGTNIPARTARSAMPTTARATALFTNMASMGSDYNSCRDAYFSCMDQFCGLKSDTYRRCLCSNKFRDFKDREDAYDAAKQMILQFNDNNLNAIDKSADEVNAMYSATSGESAMKTDNSASAQMLSNINDLLSGKTKASTQKSSTKDMAPKTLNLDFSSAAGDIWGDNSDPFAGSAKRNDAVDLENLEGADLYNAVNKQCMDAATACQNAKSSSTMVQSAYTVLVSQDCTSYEKKLDAQKSALESTIREANNQMMDARLEEFRTHNSASVNECIAKVKTAVTDQYACGPNWEKCLDFSGLYINSSTGDPIFTPQLFKLADVINLNDMNSKANSDFLSNLDNLRNRAKSALDSCRDDADTVWGAFKQQAMIEIAQAQDAKIESVKDSCVSTMKQCYDKQTGALNSFSEVKDNAEMSGAVQSASGALGVRAAKAMCSDKVLACAALYGDPDGCAVDNNGKVSDAAGKKCGLGALLAFVDTVDDTKVSTMCKSDLESYMTTLCTPEGGNTKKCNDTDNDGACSPAEIAAYDATTDVTAMVKSYPYACRVYPLKGKDSVYAKLVARAQISCINPSTNQFDPSGQKVIDDIMGDIQARMQQVMSMQCKNIDGQFAGKTLWLGGMTGEMSAVPEWANLVFGSLENYAKTMPLNSTVVFGEGLNGANKMAGLTADIAPTDPSAALMNGNTNADGWGICIPAGSKIMCERANVVAGKTVATYDDASRICKVTSEYHKTLCSILPGGTWNEGTRTCTYIP